MPKDHSQPINEADRQARAAFKAYAQWSFLQGPSGYVPSINPRTWERIRKGERDVPPGLARELAGLIRDDMARTRNRNQLADWAIALDLWADDCATRSHRTNAEVANGKNSAEDNGANAPAKGTDHA